MNIDLSIGMTRLRPQHASAAAPDPETGLSLSTTVAPAMTFAASGLDTSQPVVLAADFTGLNTSGAAGLIFE